MKNGNLLTEGNVLHVPLAFSVPFLVANVIQTLHGVMDPMVIGWYCTPTNVTAVSIGTQITQIIISMVSGLTLGGTILVEKYTGIKDEERTHCTIGITLSVFAIVALIPTVGMSIFRDAILAASKTPATSTDEARQYVAICFCGIFFVCGHSAISAILRGYGDSRRPMYFVVMSCVLNIAGGIIFMKCLGLGAAGTALATVLSQSISMVCPIVYLNRRKFIFTSTFKNLCVDRDGLKELVTVGIPISSQECMVWLLLLCLTLVANRLGVNAAAAVGIVSKYDVFVMLPVTSVASALAAITAQNYGAGKPEWVRRSLTTGIGFAVLASSVFFLWAQLSPQTIIGLFNVNPDIIEAGIPFFHSRSFDYLAVSFVFRLNGFMNGHSKIVLTMVSCCFGVLAFRMPLVWLVYIHCPDNLFVIGLIAPVMSGFMVVYTMLFVIRQLRQDNSGRRKEFTLRSAWCRLTPPHPYSPPAFPNFEQSKSRPVDLPHQQDGLLSVPYLY